MNDFFDDDRRHGGRTRRRDERRRRIRRQRRALLALVLVIVAVVVALVVVPRLRGSGDGDAQATSSPSATASEDPSPTPSASKSASATSSGTSLAAGLKIVQDPVPYGPERKRQMASYSQLHYGQSTWVLQPKAIVLHYTTGATYAPTHNFFAANTRNLGELPGACAHYVIDKDGTVYQQLSTSIRCRHTIGMNQVAIGIEFVQEGSAGAADKVLARTAQISAGLRLVKMLQKKYGIPTSFIYGHGTANSSPLFKDLKGWTNDHGDWNATETARFKLKLAQF